LDHIKAYDKDILSQLVRHREGETRIGDEVSLTGHDLQKFLADSNCRFVLLGIPEDIGVRANHGRGGASSAVHPAMESFLNLQSNAFMHGKDIALLGEVATQDLLDKAGKLAGTKDEFEQLRKLVARLDERVAEVIKTIISFNKIPIVIGGGHNNAYGCIKGAALAFGTKVNAINCDQHLDFRQREGRHSGNGFSYAWHEGWLGRYAVFGFHEQYNNVHALGEFASNSGALYGCSYEQIFIRKEIEMDRALRNCLGFVAGACGIEIDLDAIANVPSSAKSSSGFSVDEARYFVHASAQSVNAVYLHLAEGAPVLAHRKADNKTGKLIAYLICDFIKGTYRKFER
jgi:formiminoglutamase